MSSCEENDCGFDGKLAICEAVRERECKTGTVKNHVPSLGMLYGRGSRIGNITCFYFH